MTQDIIYFCLICLISGALAGLSSGLMGLGGGLVIVPVLSYLLPWFYPELNPAYVLPVAIQTSFAIIICNTLTSSFHQYKLGNLNRRTILLMAPGMAISALLVGQFVSHAPAAYLKLFFALVILYLAYKMLVKKSSAKQASFEMPESNNNWGNIPVAKTIITSLAIGAVSATAGISGGSFVSPYLYSQGMPIKRALGNASACGVFLSISGFISYLIAGKNIDTGLPLSWGYFCAIAFIAFLLTSIVFASYGVKLQSVLPAQKVKRLFAVFLIVIAFDIAYSGIRLL